MSLSNPHLTRPEGDAVADMQRRTKPGMAFWTGTGPQGASCRECVFWGLGRKFKRDTWGELRPRVCLKYSALMRGAKGPGVPHHMDACKYFEERSAPPEGLKERRSDA